MTEAIPISTEHKSSNSQIHIVGHQWAVDLLKRQVTTGRTPQALLLTGPRSIGKSTVARFFAQYLNCLANAKPCGVCLSCRKVVSGNHPDVRIWDGDEETIKIDQIRELQRELSLSPYEGQYRAVLFCNFERATPSAANALLKTLEEPNPQVVLMLTATDPGALLPTIVSRCQILALRVLPTPEVATALQTFWQASPDQAELLAQLAAGRLGWAVRALADEKLLARREQYLQDLLNLGSMSRGERLAYANDLSQDPAMLQETLRSWLTIWRDLLLIQSGSKTRILNLDWQDTLQNLAGQSNPAQTKEMVVKLRTALANLDHNVNPRLNLETVLLKMPFR
ncbi:MAG: DNA polymerase III subunit delta' [Anaerolineae bacterium]|nr:DNA polymerase III subunit delta' [Anaerolineae bacterium]